MRILFDQGAHNMRNKGNNAMLQAAMDRLSQYWPNASLEVVTDAPNLTLLYFPNAHPVSPDNLHRIHGRLGKLLRFVPRPMWWLLFELREAIWHRWPMKTPGQLRQVLRSWFPGDTHPENNLTERKVAGNDQRDKTQYQMAIREGVAGYDLIVFSGGGNLYDYDTCRVSDIFNRLEVATALGIPTVMMGQGIGPMEDSELRFRAKEVLPAVDLICVRNRRIGLSTLDSLGVSAERILFTGDDAFEMAYEARPNSLGTGIGVSLRMAGYTQVESRHLDLIRSVLHPAASARQAQLIAVPISSHHDESDITYIKRVLAGYHDASVGWRMLDTPFDAIKRVGRCRLMITGTYHGAIFALAQGIPVVALANSAEYFGKLSELTDEFGPGCQVLLLEDAKLPDELTAAIDSAWSSAEQHSPALLEAAARQIELQQTAYRRIYELVTSRNKERNP